MKESFDHALHHVLKFEGGYVNHPLDPGGATNLGITRATLARFRGRRVSKSDVRALTLEEAGQIYRAQYWDACHCSNLPPGLDLAVFDCAVNQGVRRARKILQRALGVKADGLIGSVTLATSPTAAPGAFPGGGHACKAPIGPEHRAKD